MAYATAEKIRIRLQALQAAGVSTPVDARIADAILDADAVCNAYLTKGGYPVPVTGGTEALRLLAGISSTLAAAYVVRGTFSGGGETKSPGLYETLHDEAIKMLEMIASKDLVLPVEDAADVDELPDASSLGLSSTDGQRSKIADAPFWNRYPESYFVKPTDLPSSYRW